MLVLAVIVGWLLHRSLFGFRLIAIGGNPVAARLARLPVTRYKILAFMLCSMLAAIAGILDFSFIQTTQPNIGLSYTFPVFAAVIIGGASLAGGKGTMIGTIGGALLLAELQQGLALLSPGPHVQQLFLGFVTIGAVALDLALTHVRKTQGGMSAGAGRRKASASANVAKRYGSTDRARRHRPRHPPRRGARHRRTERRRQEHAGPHHRRRGAARLRRRSPSTAGRGSPSVDWHQVAVVHQEPQLFPNLTVAENVLVGREGTRTGRPRLGIADAGVMEALGIAAAHGPLLGDCTLATQQRTEIARAVAREARVFLFDEPNSALTDEESDELFREMHKLAGDGPDRAPRHPPARRPRRACRPRRGDPRRQGARRSSRRRS